VTDRPTAPELLEAVTEFLSSEVLPTVNDARLRFRTLVALNALGIAYRELTAASGAEPRGEDELAELARSGSSIASIRKRSSWLPAPTARLAWKPMSASCSVTGSSAASRMAARASSMVAMAVRFAWAAANEAMCTSRARRTSSRSRSWRGSLRTAAVK
jgi:Domain of unknown function (DUF6285)